MHAHHAPAVLLVGVLPGAEVGRDVLGEPDEDADEEERQHERHRALRRHRREGDAAPTEDHQDGRDEREPEVGQGVVGEEVQVDERPQRHHQDRRRPAEKAETEVPPRLDHEARDARVHEAAVERHAPHLRERRLRVRPGAHAHLEELEPEAEEVEEGDDLELVARLEPGRQHEDLHGEAREQQEVVAGDRERHDLRQGEHQEDEDGEEAGARALEAEVEQLDREGGEPEAEGEREGLDAGGGHVMPPIMCMLHMLHILGCVGAHPARHRPADATCTRSAASKNSIARFA